MHTNGVVPQERACLTSVCPKDGVALASYAVLPTKTPITAKCLQICCSPHTIIGTCMSHHGQHAAAAAAARQQLRLGKVPQYNTCVRVCVGWYAPNPRHVVWVGPAEVHPDGLAEGHAAHHRLRHRGPIAPCILARVSFPCYLFGHRATAPRHQ